MPDYNNDFSDDQINTDLPFLSNLRLNASSPDEFSYIKKRSEVYLKVLRKVVEENKDFVSGAELKDKEVLILALSYFKTNFFDIYKSFFGQEKYGEVEPDKDDEILKKARTIVNAYSRFEELVTGD